MERELTPFGELLAELAAERGLEGRDLPQELSTLLQENGHSYSAGKAASYLVGDHCDPPDTTFARALAEVLELGGADLEDYARAFLLGLGSPGSPEWEL